MDHILRAPGVRCRDEAATARKIGALRRGDVAVITDFDRTVTTGSSPSSFEACEKGGILPAEYHHGARALFQKYRPIELDASLEAEEKHRLLRKWCEEHIGLLKTYGARRGMFDAVAREVLAPRAGALEFLRGMADLGAPVAVLSAGLEDTIRPFLASHGLAGAHVRANRMLYDGDGACVGHQPDTIHSSDKHVRAFPADVMAAVRAKSHVLLLGDMPEDAKVLGGQDGTRALKIGFGRDARRAAILSRHFDVAVEDDGGDGGVLGKILAQIG